MATKTISLELDAYEKLCQARRSARESFSSVVRRAHWDQEKYQAKNVVLNLSQLFREHPESFLADSALNRIARRVRRRTVRPKSRWQ